MSGAASTPDAQRGVARFLPLVAVLAAAILFRLPPILHAAQTNSDAAIVGLQAMHVLRGEWSWFLWGSGYQTSVDAAFAAVLFGLAGATPRALLCSSLALHLVATSLLWSTLARRIGPARAALAVFPLVLTSSPLQTYILYPPRQASLTIAVAALWALDRAADAQRVRAFVVSGALVGLACFADPYALVLVPPLAAFAIACSLGRGTRATAANLAAFAAGASLGAVPFALLRVARRATSGQLALGLDPPALARHARLLVESALPWTLGARAYSASSALGYGPWPGPLAVRVLLLVGGGVFLGALVVGGALAVARSVSWPVRRLAIAGAVGYLAAIGGFLVSPMVMDLFSSRYLAAIPLLAPLALAPLAARFGARRFGVFVAPAALACAIAGWVGYGPFLATPSEDDARLVAALAERGIRFATADYWAAYRLTFLARERVTFVPTNVSEDRYPPYRAAFDAAPIVAYVFDPERSREQERSMDSAVESGHTAYAPHPEEIDVGRFRVLLLTRER